MVQRCAQKVSILTQERRKQRLELLKKRDLGEYVRWDCWTVVSEWWVAYLQRTSYIYRLIDSSKHERLQELLNQTAGYVEKIKLAMRVKENGEHLRVERILHQPLMCTGGRMHVISQATSTHSFLPPPFHSFSYLLRYGSLIKSRVWSGLYRCTTPSWMACWLTIWVMVFTHTFSRRSSGSPRCSDTPAFAMCDVWCVVWCVMCDQFFFPQEWARQFKQLLSFLTWWRQSWTRWGWGVFETPFHWLFVF